MPGYSEKLISIETNLDMEGFVFFNSIVHAYVLITKLVSGIIRKTSVCLPEAHNPDKK